MRLFKSIRQAVIAWFERGREPARLSYYIVTPRQGRHTVRRRLLRRLPARLAAQSSSPVHCPARV